MVGVWGAGRALVLRGDTSACGIAASQLRTPRGIAMLCVRRSTHDADPDISILENPILAARFIEFVNSCTGCWPFGRLYHNNQVLCSPYPQSDAETGKPLVFPPLDRPEDIFSEFGSSL